MTHVVQQETAQRIYKPLATTPRGRPRLPGEPVGILYHTEDSLAIDDIGASDTGGFRLNLDLLPNYAHRLLTAVGTIRGPATNWTNPGLRVFYHPDPSVSPGVTTQLDTPLAQAPMTEAEAVASTTVSFGQGGGSAATGTGVGSNAIPYQVNWPIMYGFTAGGGIAPQFMMSNLNATEVDYFISYLFRWLVYTIEDSLTTAIYYQVPTHQD